MCGLAKPWQAAGTLQDVEGRNWDSVVGDRLRHSLI